MLKDFPKTSQDIMKTASILSRQGKYIDAISLLRKLNTQAAEYQIAFIMTENKLSEAAMPILLQLLAQGYETDNVDELLFFARMDAMGITSDDFEDIFNDVKNVSSEKKLPINFMTFEDLQSYLFGSTGKEPLTDEDFSIVPKSSGIFEETDEKFVEALEDDLTVKNCLAARHRILDVISKNPTNVWYHTVALCVFCTIVKDRKCAKKDAEILNDILRKTDQLLSVNCEYYHADRLGYVLGVIDEHERALKWFNKIYEDKSVPLYSPMYLPLFQGLYNADQKVQARKLIYNMYTVYPCEINRYYLHNFNKLPEKLAYTHDLPKKVAQEYRTSIREIKNWKNVLSVTKHKRHIDWALRDSYQMNHLSFNVIQHMLQYYSPANREYLSRLLIRPTLDPDVKATIILGMLLFYSEKNIPIATREGEFFRLNVKLPKTLTTATAFAVSKLASRYSLDDETIDKMVMRAIELSDKLTDNGEEDYNYVIACIIAKESGKDNLYELFGCTREQVEELSRYINE